jgi:two-component system response regulator PilR (NtrC family)
MSSILVVDDERSMRELLEIMLRKQHHQATTAATLAEALTRIRTDEFDLVISDLKLGSESGLSLLEAVKARSPDTQVVMITAFATTENAVQAMKMGAYDYVLKPFKLEELQLVAEKALEHRRLLTENRVLRHRVGDRGAGPEPILGHSPAIEQVREVVARVGPTRSTVLLTGESGTGKEVVARAIHAAGDRRDLPFVAVNCGAIPEGLIESEFFGHEKGAFTGAGERRAGLFEVAGSGTLFLDEVGELPPAVQVKLLRALQERCIRRVGGSTDIGISARIVGATNRDLAEEVRVGRFREDLYYRLNVIHLRIPALRERRDDLPEFYVHFLARLAAEHGREVPTLSAEATRLLQGYAFPGNLRELANILERAITLSTGPVIGPDALPATVRGGPAGLPSLRAADSELPSDGLDLQAYLDAIERRVLEQALARTGGVKTEAARLLSLTFRSLRYRLAKYGIGEG